MFHHIQLPTPLHRFFSYFPLYITPSPDTSFYVSPTPSYPVIWIKPPAQSDSILSRDVECLKWQAYLALRGDEGVRVRWDVQEEGGIDGRLPNLYVPKLLVEVGAARKEGGEVLPAHLIPEWVDTQLGTNERLEGDLEGYRDLKSKDESRAWVTLLEGTVHAALVAAAPQPHPLSSFSPLHVHREQKSIQPLLNPPPAPLSGLSSLLPPYGTRVPIAELEAKYNEAIAALSERLGNDKWFLGSDAPTPLDALAFAYIHTILHLPSTTQTQNHLRSQVTRRVNLVAWERRVSGMVRAPFSKA